MRGVASLLLVLLLFSNVSKSQVVFQPLTSSIYEYIDEMANIGYIEINSVVKPYSRKLIASKLNELVAVKDTLNKRQLGELQFFLQDYNKELVQIKKEFKKRLDMFYYGDSLFAITVNPIGGGKTIVNENGYAYHRWSGAELYGSIGKHFGFSMSLRDNGISQDLYSKDFLVQEQGGNYKIVPGGDRNYEFSEVYGALTYSWDWGSTSIRKDNFTWGNNYNGANIFSGRTPTFAYLHLKLTPTKWFDFNYYHGYLVSEAIDSSATYWIDGQRRRAFFSKYIAANIFTLKPFKAINVSAGNSIIYSDQGVNPAYLIPFLFYKSVDHTYNGTGANDLGQNSQMFGDISIRTIPKTHIYATLYFDELSISNSLDKENHTNIYSGKIGIRASNLIPNTTLTFEYTRNSPWVYRHQIPQTRFSSNQYNLGHYLRDNSQETYGSISFKPLPNLFIEVSFTEILKGIDDYTVINGIAQVAGSVFMEQIDWVQKEVSLKIIYEPLNDVRIYTQYKKTDNSGLSSMYAPEIYQGNTNSFIGGVNFGF
ncbi:MAG: hypothetical protein HOK72_01425 [Flavobacteriales bacterium]|jgi:hypothetical protein|nr:hypothetical protein [Flavobacteriales bacterium]